MFPKRIVFMGTPDFACPSLLGLAEAGAPPCLVVTQPDRPAGRHRALAPPPVKELALRLGLPIIQPPSLKAPEARDAIAEAGPDAIVVAAFGQILPKAVLEIPPLGCINVHASLLPRHRGASPIARAIWEGDAVTGITIMRMDAGLDTGPTYLSREMPILPAATAGDMEPLLAGLGAGLLLEALPEIAAGTMRPEPQDDSLATYAPRLKREDGLLDFSQPAARLERQVRALFPWPGAFFRGPEIERTLHREEIKVLRAALGPPAPPGASSGQVLEGPGLSIACGEGSTLHLVEIQRPGKRAQPSDVVLRGYTLGPGTLLG